MVRRIFKGNVEGDRRQVCNEIVGLVKTGSRI